MKIYNGLYPEEIERLAMLSEEAGEIVQSVGKILRHGYKSYHPDNPEVSNEEDLVREIRDLVAVVEIMESYGDIHVDTDVEDLVAKKKRYMHVDNEEF